MSKTQCFYCRIIPKRGVFYQVKEHVIGEEVYVCPKCYKKEGYDKENFVATIDVAILNGTG